MKYADLLTVRRALRDHPRLRFVASGETRKGNTYYLAVEDAQTGKRYQIRSRMEWNELLRGLASDA